MYTALLVLHSWLRWLALAAVILVVIRAMLGAASSSPFGEADNKWIKGAAHLLTAQAMIGILLYAVSPYIRSLLGDMGAAMRDKTSRMFVVEHVVIMLIVVALAHMGFAIARKGKDHKARHTRIAIFYGIGLLLMAYAIPWMRPLFRFGLATE
jgi:hypothetical protein